VHIFVWLDVAVTSIWRLRRRLYGCQRAYAFGFVGDVSTARWPIRRSAWLRKGCC